MNIYFHILLGVNADDKTGILNDSRIVGKILIRHNVLHKLL